MNITFEKLVIEPSYVAPVVKEITTEDLLALCGSWDAQALYSAVAALVLVMLSMYYFLRWRKHIGTDTLRAVLDKFLLTMAALLIVIVIVRLLRAG